MKAVILAAGQGTRIRSVHGEHPKCLIEVDNTTILDHQLEALSVAGIKDVAIVVGYEKGQIISHVRTRQHRQNIQFIENSAFAITNNIYSLWLARHLLEAGRHIDWAFVRGSGEADAGKVHRSVTASDHYPISFELFLPG